MTLSLYLTVAGRSPQRHATLPTHGKVRSTAPYYKVLLQYNSVLKRLQYYKVLFQYYSVVPLQYYKA